MNNNQIIKAEEKHLQYWLQFTASLWPDTTAEEMKEEFHSLLNSANDIVYFSLYENEFTGFVHAATRYDYVEGTDSSPVGYIEGIYVKENYRNRGIASALINAIEIWCKERGMSQLASDAEFQNIVSQQFHKATGFTEAIRIVCFVKNINV